MAGINFATWMSFTVPLMVVNLVLAWLWLAKMYSWQRAREEKERTLTIDVGLNGADDKLNVAFQSTLVDNGVHVTINPTAELVAPQSPILMKKRHQSKLTSSFMAITGTEIQTRDR